MEILEHILYRGIDLDVVTPQIGDGVATFFLYDLSGNIVGYQHYNPLGTKAFNQKKADRSLMKYFTYVKGSKRNDDKSIGVWGLESYSFRCKRIFLTEGLFDAAPFHRYGECALAVLSNDPSKSVIEWLGLFPQEIIVVSDRDGAGKKLEKCGDRVIQVPLPHKDVGELWESGGFSEWYESL